ncbi:MAG TPA: diguanylate cyclase [Longimicrobiaceae bacterium]|nr:diguanylate cyclase [Longimicrobiaceae bacterium]
MTEGEAPDPEETRILVVDDHPDNVEIIDARLSSRGYLIETASNGQEALARVHANPPHLILCDVMMPVMDGYEVSRRVKNDETLPYIPIILVTARDSTADKVEGLEAGADDYLTKPINFPELEARVRSMLRIKRLQDELDLKNRELERANQELEVANRKLRKLSITDGLTELFNHRHVHELLHEEFERSRRSGEPMAVAMIDLDRFKAVNDTYGHPTGDVILYETARIIRETAREIDMVGRYGGEEFIAILPNTDEEDAGKFAERVRRSVEGYVFRDEAHEVRMTASSGVASFPGLDIDAPETLLKRADAALYAAKESGRNRVVRSSEMPAPA